MPTKVHNMPRHRTKVRVIPDSVPPGVIAARAALFLLRGAASSFDQWLGVVEHAFIQAVAPRVKIAVRKAAKRKPVSERKTAPTKATKATKEASKTPGAPRRVSHTARRRSSHEPEKRD